MKSVVIIGGGLGGLFSGAILAKEGFSVTVLEKNATIGGGLQSFTRFGEVFDTGMHVIGGMQPGGNIERLCRYLGISGEANVMPVDDNCTDDLDFAEDDTHYLLRKGKDGLIESLSGYFPQSRHEIEAYMNDVFGIVSRIDMFNLRPTPVFTPFPADDSLLAAAEIIAKHITDRRLRSVIAYMNPLYGGMGGKTPAYIHAIVTVLYAEGTSRFVGGSVRFARLLANVITEHGGKVMPADGVEWIETSDKMVTFVRTRSGRRYTADHYISAIHPCTLLTLMSEKSFTKSYRDRLNSIPSSYSAFSLYVKMKDGTFPYINHSEYYMSRYDDIWEFANPDKKWPLGFLLMTPPEQNQGKFSRKVLLTAPMRFDEVKPWEATTTGHRGSSYEQWKRERAAQLLDMIEKMHPGFSSNINKIITSSPLTIRDFYGVKGGALSGFSKDCHNMALSQLPVVTKVRNLLLTGQNNSLHGFCGVALTAISTSEVLLGHNYIINKINDCAPASQSPCTAL